MTLNEVKELLSANGITFELQEFQNEAAYFQHLTLSYTKKTRPDKVIALIIKSKNGKKTLNFYLINLTVYFALKNYHLAITALKCLILPKNILQMNY